jgi:hypothetical protein
LVEEFNNVEEMNVESHFESDLNYPAACADTERENIVKAMNMIVDNRASNVEVMTMESDCEGNLNDSVQSTATKTCIF